MEGWIVFLLVVIVAVLILGRKQFGRVVDLCLLALLLSSSSLCFFGRSLTTKSSKNIQDHHNNPNSVLTGEV